MTKIITARKQKRKYSQYEFKSLVVRRRTESGEWENFSSAYSMDDDKGILHARSLKGLKSKVIAWFNLLESFE